MKVHRGRRRRDAAVRLVCLVVVAVTLLAPTGVDAGAQPVVVTENPDAFV